MHSTTPTLLLRSWPLQGSSEEQSRFTAAPVSQTLCRLENKHKPEEEAEREKRRRKNGEEGDAAPIRRTKFIVVRGPNPETQRD